MTGWVRTGGGKAIHRPDCHMVERATRKAFWHWADEATTDLELLAKMGFQWGPKWNRFCYFCCHSGWSEQRFIERQMAATKSE